MVPHLWFDKEAKEAAEFYAATFGGDSKVKNVNVLHDTPSSDVDVVMFNVWGFPFMAISAGPRGGVVHSVLRHAGRNRLLLEETFRRAGIGAVRLAQR